MLDSIYHDVKIILYSRFWFENVNMLPNVCDVAMSFIS